jgi:hypothetical protein
MFRDGIFKLLRSTGIDTASLWDDRYDNCIPTRFLAPTKCSEIPALCLAVASDIWTTMLKVVFVNLLTHTLSEPVFVHKCLRSSGINFKESMPAHEVWRAGMSNKVVVPARQGWESIPRLLKRLTNSGKCYKFFCLN